MKLPNKMKILKEWFIQVPWGKIALISWGNPNGEPVLLVHGRQDSAATFLPLLELLPDVYHYVGFDLPGHGLSDPIPIGLALTRFIAVVALDAVIKHLQWTNFTYIGHSMGAETGLLYNGLASGRIKKYIFLDGGPALQRLMIQDFPTFFSYYQRYYDNYSYYNIDDRVYSKADVLKAVMNARGMNEAQAEIILSRNLKKIGEDQYKLSWDKRCKIMIPTFCAPDYYYKLFSKNTPPTLYINATDSIQPCLERKKIVDSILSDLQRNVKNFFVMSVRGTHDVHFINPERISKEVCSFLTKDFGNTKSKL